MTLFKIILGPINYSYQPLGFVKNYFPIPYSSSILPQMPIQQTLPLIPTSFYNYNNNKNYYSNNYNKYFFEQSFQNKNEKEIEWSKISPITSTAMEQQQSKEIKNKKEVEFDDNKDFFDFLNSTFDEYQKESENLEAKKSRVFFFNFN